MPEHLGGVELVEADSDGEGELMQRHQEAAETGEHIDQRQQPEMRRAHRLAQRPAAARRRRAPPARSRAFAARTAEHRGERQERRRHEPALRQIGAAPAERGDQHLRQRRRERAREAVGRLHDRHRHAAVAHEAARQDRHEHHQPEAVRAERHHHAVQHDHLPQRVGEGAGDQADREQEAADQDQPPRPEPIDQDADQRRRRPADQLRHRIGDRGFRRGSSRTPR